MASTRSPQIRAVKRKPWSASLRRLAWSVGCLGLRTSVMVMVLSPPRCAGQPWADRRQRPWLGYDDLVQLGHGLLLQLRRHRSKVVLGRDLCLAGREDEVEEPLERLALGVIALLLVDDDPGRRGDGIGV